MIWNISAKNNLRDKRMDMEIYEELVIIFVAITNDILVLMVVVMAQSILFCY